MAMIHGETANDVPKKVLVNDDGSLIVLIRTNPIATATSFAVTVDTSSIIVTTNSTRRKIILQNVSTVPIYVLLGTGTASPANYSFVLKGGDAAADGLGGTFIDDMYTGGIVAVGASAGGILRSVEL